MGRYEPQPAVAGPDEQTVSLADSMPAAKNRTRLTAKQKRMKRAIRYLADYFGSYEKQLGCLDYTDKTLIDDVLYGLGVALDPMAHMWAGGYEVWKNKLREHLAADKAKA